MKHISLVHCGQMSKKIRIIGQNIELQQLLSSNVLVRLHFVNCLKYALMNGHKLMPRRFFFNILFPEKNQEILELCEVIYMNGYSLDESEVDEDTAAFSVIKFGDLFKMYTRITDKVVGLLLRAKKYRLVYFEPEMLFQGKLKVIF